MTRLETFKLVLELIFGETPTPPQLYRPTYVEQEIANMLAEDENNLIGAYLLESAGLVAVQNTEQARLH